MLPDLLQENLEVVFCGTAVGNRSASQKHYYAGCGNKFYCVLYNCGFTPVQMIPSEYEKLLEYDIGLTDLVKTKAGMDNTLRSLDYNIEDFQYKIEKYSPQIVCFNGKEAAKEFFDVKNTSFIKYGLQTETIGITKIFVAPSTSPTAHKYWDERPWENLKKLVL